jgi:type II secretory pathway pseudopilin PulG
VSRCKSLIAIVAVLIVATALAAAALPQKADAATLRGKLRVAKRALRHSNHRLENARVALAAALATTAAMTTTGDATDAPSPSPVAAAPSLDELKARVAKARRAVRIWERRVHRLTRIYRLRQRIADWERRGKWMPIIEIAAAKYHVKADGMYRMMMRESGGRRRAGSSSAFKGLFQYHPGTWAASWNPFRHHSIYDGSSQIFATCYAVGRGMGPSMWTSTFASQY